MCIADGLVVGKAGHLKLLIIKTMVAILRGWWENLASLYYVVDCNFFLR